jgi:hypothetical protein
MAKAPGVSHTLVGRIWRTFRLQPHRTESFKIPAGAAARREDPRRSSVCTSRRRRMRFFSVDEKSQIQTLQRLQPIVPMDFGQPERRTHNYIRHRTVDRSPRSILRRAR